MAMFDFQVFGDCRANSWSREGLVPVIYKEKRRVHRMPPGSSRIKYTA